MLSLCPHHIPVTAPHGFLHFPFMLTITTAVKFLRVPFTPPRQQEPCLPLGRCTLRNNLQGLRATDFLRPVLRPSIHQQTQNLLSSLAPRPSLVQLLLLEHSRPDRPSHQAGGAPCASGPGPRPPLPESLPPPTGRMVSPPHQLQALFLPRAQ